MNRRRIGHFSSKIQENTGRKNTGIYRNAETPALRIATCQLPLLKLLDFLRDASIGGFVGRSAAFSFRTGLTLIILIIRNW
jgi:hypothetical protein